MYSTHSDFVTPPDETVIWRYMSVEKYISLLHASAIFMCRLDKFEDPWEGTYPAGYEEYNPQIAKSREAQRGFLFVSCWHGSDHESAAMWDLYSSRHAGVAIRTTIGDLKSSITSEREIFIGSVKYEDYSEHIPNLRSNLFLPALIKRKSFSHEREIRMLSLDFEGDGWESCDAVQPHYGYAIPVTSSLSCDVDLDCLLRDVLFSPFMPNWLSDAIEDVSSRYGIGSSFKKSDLYDPRMI